MIWLYLFYISCTLQLIFLLLAWYAFHKSAECSSHINQKKKFLPVSIIICARNEVANLKALLPLLYQQDYPEYEIIVVNDNSTDHPEDFLKSEIKKQSRLKVLQLINGIPGKKNALRKGVLMAQHSIILLTDADCRPVSNRWIQTMCRPFNEPKIKIVLGYAPYFVHPGLLNAFIGYETLYTAILYLSAARLGFPYMGVGRNLAYKKSLFIQNKPHAKHDSILSGDDDLFINKYANRTNTQVVINMHGQVKSIPQTSITDFLKQKHRHLEAGKFYKLSDRLWLGTVVLSHLLFWICFCLLLFYNYRNLFIITGCFLIRTICLIIVYKYVSRKLNDQINLRLLVILDFLFVIYYAITGVKAFFFKKRQWK